MKSAEISLSLKGEYLKGLYLKGNYLKDMICDMPEVYKMSMVSMLYNGRT